MQANSDKSGNAAVVPVKDLTKQELQAALLYGTIASCAYIDTEEEVGHLPVMTAVYHSPLVTQPAANVLLLSLAHQTPSP